MIIWTDEDGETAWMSGHVAASVAVRRTRRWLLGEGHHLARDLPPVAAMRESVHHGWYRQVGPDEENYEQCEETDEGAEPYTSIDLTW